jgi:mannosyltransferase
MSTLTQTETTVLEPARLRPERARLADVAVVTLPALLALGLCLYGVGSRSLGFDEAATVAIASQHGSALGHAIAHDGGNMSVYYLGLHVLIGLFGDGLWVIRTPSAVAAALTAGLTGLLALRLFDRRVALVAGVFTAVSLPLVFWGQSARGYAFMVALVCGSFVAFEALMGRRGRPALTWFAYVACTTLAVYCGFVAVLIVPAQLVLLIGRPRPTVRRVIAGLAAGALLCLPLVVLAASRGSGQLFWVPRPSLNLDGQVLESLASAALAPSFHTTATTLPLLVLSGCALAALAWTRPRQASLPIIWLVLPVGLAFVESVVGQPVFIARNLLTVLPAAAILLGLALADRRLPKLAAGALLAAFLVLRALQLAPAYGTSPEAWRAASAYVLTHTRAGDCSAFYPADGHMAFAYYVPRSTLAPRSILPATRWTNPPEPYVEDYASLSRARVNHLGCSTIWLLSSHQGQPDGPAGARANLARFKRLRRELEAAYPSHRRATFGYAATITVERLARPAG